MMFFHHAKKVTYKPSIKLAAHSWSASIVIENGVETIIHLFFKSEEDAGKCDGVMREAGVDHGTHSVGAISLSVHFIEKCMATREDKGFMFDFGHEAIGVFSA